MGGMPSLLLPASSLAWAAASFVALSVPVLPVPPSLPTNISPSKRRSLGGGSEAATVSAWTYATLGVLATSGVMPSGADASTSASCCASNSRLILACSAAKSYCRPLLTSGFFSSAGGSVGVRFTHIIIKAIAKPVPNKATPPNIIFCGLELLPPMLSTSTTPPSILMSPTLSCMVGWSAG